MQDISQKKEIENSLIQAKNRAEQSEKLKTTFLENISHEIRTPMNGINGFANLLYQEEVPEQDKQLYLEIIYKNSNRLLSLINNILDISKIETNQLILYKKECSLDNIFKDITQKVHHSFSQYSNINLKIKNRIDYESGFIITDGNRLKQIIINLIENAFKFTKYGYIEVDCAIVDNKQLIFSVKDNGEGISIEFQNEIFNIFTKSNSSIKANTQGVGLGLSISKGLVENLGGKIWLDSSSKTGTTICFTIPYQPTKVPTEPLSFN
jgi:signal transduction histidine kinase